MTAPPSAVISTFRPLAAIDGGDCADTVATTQSASAAAPNPCPCNTIATLKLEMCGSLQSQRGEL